MIGIILLSIFIIGCGTQAPADEQIQEAEPEEQVMEEKEEPPVEQPAQPPAQQQQAPQMTSTITPARDLTGTWVGSIEFTNNCANPTCRYVGKMTPHSIELNLVQNGNNVNGNIVMYFANFEIQQLLQNMPCGTFQDMVNRGVVGRGVIANGVVSSSRFTFDDPGDNHWELSMTTDLLQGRITSNVPGCMGIQSNKVKLSRERFASMN